MGTSVRRFFMMGLLALIVASVDILSAQAQDDPARLYIYPPKDKKGGKNKGGGGTTLPENMFVAEGFRVERLYVVPQSTQGSWVAMTVDPQGRLVAGGRDEAGIFRITPPPLDGKPEDTKVEKLAIDLASPNGLLYAFDSLYVMRCSGGGGGKGKGGAARPNGLYRVTASKPGGEYDTVKLLRALQGGGDHGPHAILLTPGGKSLTVVCGNDTKATEYSNSYLPRLWGEDALYPLLSSFSGVTAPAGWMARVDPEGKKWELYTAGFRNEYDAAFNHNGDLLTYDSDMEWDIGTPWYRPTRVSMAVSGGDAGFRNGSRVMPPRYPDSVPPIVDIGLGSPTGVDFGYGAKFPAKYQEALFINDWSYGRMLAVHLKPQGSAYTATVETFLSGPGLSLTDMVVNPKDGALYFCVGGNSQSALYRVTYIGKESTAPAKNDDSFAVERALRHKLEAFHGRQDPKAVETAWPFMGHEDRFIRFAARVAIEHQDVKQWQERAMKETNHVAATHALLALVRAVGKDPITLKQGGGKGMGGGKGKDDFGKGKDDFGKGGGFTDAAKDQPKDSKPVAGVEFKVPILDALDRIDIAKFDDAQKSALLRVYAVTFNRLGKPDDSHRESFIKRFDPLFPAPMKGTNIGLNADLCELLCYLETPGIQAQALKAIESAQKRPAPSTRAWTAMPSYQGPTAPSQMEELTYAWRLAYLKTGWTEPLQTQITDLWKTRFSTFRGGNRYREVVNTMQQMTTQNARPVLAPDAEPEKKK